MLSVMAGSAFAASSATDSVILEKGNVREQKISFVAHTDGTFTSYAMTEAINGYVWMVVTDPGSTAPTASYDITLLDAQGVDIMSGNLADRSATVTEQAYPTRIRPVNGKLTLTISNNSANGATGDVYIYSTPFVW